MEINKAAKKGSELWEGVTILKKLVKESNSNK